MSSVFESAAKNERRRARRAGPPKASAMFDVGRSATSAEERAVSSDGRAAAAHSAGNEPAGPPETLSAKRVPSKSIKSARNGSVAFAQGPTHHGWLHQPVATHQGQIGRDTIRPLATGHPANLEPPWREQPRKTPLPNAEIPVRALCPVCGVRAT